VEPVYQGAMMSPDYLDREDLDLEDGDLDFFTDERGKNRSRFGGEDEPRGRKDRLSPRERIRRLRKSHTRY